MLGTATRAQARSNAWPRPAALHVLSMRGGWLRRACHNGISKLVFTILSAVAEAERDRIRERVATVKADQRARGRYLGGIVPFGYAVGADGGLEAQPDQQAAIARMRALRLAGGSLRSIAAEMRLAGHPLSHKGLRGILAGAAAT